jgi:hypothetical protein
MKNKEFYFCSCGWAVRKKIASMESVGVDRGSRALYIVRHD